MQVSRVTVLPVVVGPDDPLSAAHPTDPFVASLSVAYTTGPPFGQQLLTWHDLNRLGRSRRELRQEAAANLYRSLGRVQILGQPPALLLSFDGLESSVLLAHRFWDDLATSVPGELVVGVPARDVVIFTGSDSASGMRRVRRAVDRMFLARGSHLLSRDLLVRRQRRWEVLRLDPHPLDEFDSGLLPVVPPDAGRPVLPPGHPSGELPRVPAPASWSPPAPSAAPPHLPAPARPFRPAPSRGAWAPPRPGRSASIARVR